MFYIIIKFCFFTRFSTFPHHACISRLSEYDWLIVSSLFSWLFSGWKQIWSSHIEQFSPGALESCSSKFRCLRWSTHEEKLHLCALPRLHWFFCHTHWVSDSRAFCSDSWALHLFSLEPQRMRPLARLHNCFLKSVYNWHGVPVLVWCNNNDVRGGCIVMTVILREVILKFCHCPGYDLRLISKIVTCPSELLEN